MSIEMDDKKARKEAKRAAKLAKLAASQTGEESTVQSTKKSKKDKGKAKEAPLTQAILVEEAEKVDVDIPASGAFPGEAVGADEVVLAKAEKKRLKAERKARKAEKRAKREREVDETPVGVEEASLASHAKGDGEGEAERPKKKKKTSKDTPTPADTIISTPLATSPLLDDKPKKAKLADGAKGSANSTEPTALSAEDNKYLAENSITLLPPLYPPSLSIPSLPIQAALLDHLSKFERPTLIQACTWAPLLDGRDVVGIAETGSGKTLAFGIPALHRLSTSSSTGSSYSQANGKGKSNKGNGKTPSKIGVLVLAPTRELAQQSHETFVDAGKKLGISSTCIFGGVGKEGQYKDLRDPRVRVVVGTPGRTLDLADAGDLDLSNVSYLVLDEADRMLDQGFENDIRRIIAHCPGNEARQTVMFSATWPESVRRLAGTFLRDPIRVTVGSDELSANKRIEQVVEVLDDVRQKDSRMLYHLKSHLAAHPSSPAAPTRILVFALYKKEAQRLEYTIRRSGYSIAGLHGDLSQDARFKALDKFKRGEVNVLVATDVAARGLDIPDVGLVLNVTFPLTTEDFVHRCGRTGRAGKTGKAVTLFTGEGHEKALAGELMRVLRDAGAKVPKEMDRFPTTIKKKEHGSYGAFYKDISDAPAPTKIVFD